MTDSQNAGGASSCVDAAVESADAAACAAGVSVRDLGELNEFDAVCQLYAAIWRDDGDAPKVTVELLRALSASGNYVAGAFEGEQLVGACVGFFCGPSKETVHSHIAGVSPALRGRSVGYALKLHQRVWALLRAASTISWTFDPLVSRNAYFNITKLAVTPIEYLPNFYGGMRDKINQNDDSDRLLVRWQLDADRVMSACLGRSAPVDASAERARGAAVGLRSSASGWPIMGSIDAATVLMEVPSDVETLRRSDPRCARQWRLAVREVLGQLMATGGRVAGFDRRGWYVIGREGTITDEESV